MTRPADNTAIRERVPAKQRLVARSALFDVLSGAARGQVVLLCAPPGSGKTVLLRSWAESKATSDRVAWVSVERGEADAQHFWLSLVDAFAGAVREQGLVERVERDAGVPRRGRDRPAAGRPRRARGAGAAGRRRSPRAAMHRTALRLLEHFLSRVPSQVQVVLSTREDPGLGLHRLRLTGDLVEIRGNDLRFSLEETRGLLEAGGIALPDAAVARLHERTEGWAAGLRLAAISLESHPDRERFVTEFSGSERTVAAYLLAEVLEGQPAEVRDLLLRTSILDRVSGPLADFLTGGSGSEAHPAAARRRERVRVVGRRRPVVVPLSPSVRRPLAARAAAARPATIGAAPPGGRRVARGARRHGRGDPPRAGGGRLAGRVAHARRQLRQPGLRRPPGDASRPAGRPSRRMPPTRTRSSRSPSRRPGSTTAC